ncbi:MAG: hypothetical protein R2854_24475 [Caldilineaceae bacterium]
MPSGTPIMIARARARPSKPRLRSINVPATAVTAIGLRVDVAAVLMPRSPVNKLRTYVMVSVTAWPRAGAKAVPPGHGEAHVGDVDDGEQHRQRSDEASEQEPKEPGDLSHTERSPLRLRQFGRNFLRQMGLKH